MHVRLWTSLALLLLAAGVSTRDNKRLLVFDNFMHETIWVASQGTGDNPAVNDGGWEMKPSTRLKVHVKDTWSGRFWGRTKCDVDGKCETGSCGAIKCKGHGGEPPFTSLELTLNGGRGIHDSYFVSVVNGFNMKASIAPLSSQPPNNLFCIIANCAMDIEKSCPEELQKVVDDRVVGCNSACAAFNTDQYCCRGDYNSSYACKTREWPENYAQNVFRSQCDALTTVYDVLARAYACEDQGFRIKFG